MSRTGGRQGWPKITCLIDTRKTYAHTCKNAHKDTKIKSFSESGSVKVSKNIEKFFQLGHQIVNGVEFRKDRHV